MDEYERRYAAALDELSAAGVWDSNAEPPFNRWARKLGLRPRPPQYDPFWKVVAGHGLVFAVLWAAINWLTVWRVEGTDPAEMFRSTMVVAGIFGFLMAFSCLYTRIRHSLSRWRDL